VFVAAAAVFITITGSLGGNMVYQRGVGVHTSMARPAGRRA
jgi:uncharacterized membrane protein